MTNILSGKDVSSKIYDELRHTLSRASMLPRMVLYSDQPDAATRSYMKSIVTQGEKLGIKVEVFQATESVEKDMTSLNESDDVAGVMIMHPFKDANEMTALRLLKQEKDLEGRTAKNLGAVVEGDWLFAPPTAEAVMEILDYYNIEVSGKDIVIVGRSTTVGKPLAMMLLKKGIDATVTVCHSRTTKLEEKTRAAEILVCAVGRAGFVTRNMVRKGSTVIDVGINFEHGKLVGDVAFDEVKDVVKEITPVPGGIGSVTTAVLFRHYGTSLRLMEEGH